MAQSSGDRPTTGAPTAAPSTETPQRAVFRMPFIAVVLLPILAAFCLGPIATVNVWWALLFVVPVLIGVAVVLTRTEVDGQAITVHGLRPKRRLPWPDLDRLEFSGPRWAVAVSTDERRMRLPMVRPRDLPTLAAVSGGYLTFTAPPVPGSDEEISERDDVDPDGTGSHAGADGAPTDPAPSDGGGDTLVRDATTTPPAASARSTGDRTPDDRPATPSGGSGA